MIKINRNTKIGIFALSAFIILCFGLNFLKGRDVFFRGNKYYGYFANVDGLTDASPIFYNGYKIGSVRQIDICTDATDESRRFVATFAVEMNLNLPQNTVAEIYSTDILGGKGIRFLAGNSANLLESGDTIKTAINGGLIDEIMPMKDRAEALMMHLDSTMMHISTLIGGVNGNHLSNAINSIDKSMANIEAVTASLANMTKPNGSITRAMNTLDSLMLGLQANSKSVDSVMSNINLFTAKLCKSNLDSTILSLNLALNSVNGILQNVDSAQGTLGKLVNDTKLYDKLAESSANLNRLLVDVRMNPSRYVNISAVDFGRNVYFGSPTGEAMIGVVFQIKLLESKKAVDFPEYNVAEMPVIEYYDGKRYRYSVGSFRNYSDAEEALSSVSKDYPKSEIIALENGSLISLTKAKELQNK